MIDGSSEADAARAGTQSRAPSSFIVDDSVAEGQSTRKASASVRRRCRSSDNLEIGSQDSAPTPPRAAPSKATCTQGGPGLQREQLRRTVAFPPKRCWSTRTRSAAKSMPPSIEPCFHGERACVRATLAAALGRRIAVLNSAYVEPDRDLTLGRETGARPLPETRHYYQRRSVGSPFSALPDWHDIGKMPPTVGARRGVSHSGYVQLYRRESFHRTVRRALALSIKIWSRWLVLKAVRKRNHHRTHVNRYYSCILRRSWFEFVFDRKYI